MISIERAIKTVSKISDAMDECKTKDRLNQLLADYITLYERRENTLSRQIESRKRVQDDDDDRIDRNLYHNMYYHTVVKPKKMAEKKKREKEEKEKEKD